MPLYISYLRMEHFTLRAPVGKSDGVRTTVSVKTLTVSSVEELNTRSMSLSACPCDLLVTVGSHEQQSISRRAPPPGRHFWSRARMGLWSGVRARIDTVSTTVHRSLTAVVRGKSPLFPCVTALSERYTVIDTVSKRARTPLHSPIRARDQKCPSEAICSVQAARRGRHRPPTNYVATDAGARDERGFGPHWAQLLSAAIVKGDARRALQAVDRGRDD